MNRYENVSAREADSRTLMSYMVRWLVVLRYSIKIEPYVFYWGKAHMDKFRLSVVWLKIVSILFALFGIVIALFNQTSLFQMTFNNQINPVFWGNTQLSA